jgi:hypothetical protein
MPGLLKAVPTELARYELNFVLVQGFILVKVDTEWAVGFTNFFVANRNESQIRERIFFLRSMVSIFKGIYCINALRFCIVLGLAGAILFFEMLQSKCAKNYNLKKILRKK